MCLEKGNSGSWNSPKEIREELRNLKSEFYNLRLKNGGLAQLARAPALHAGGQRFDSVILHWSERTKVH